MKKPQVVPWYDDMIKQQIPKPPLFRRIITAFISGGAFCAIAEAAQHGFRLYYSKDEATALVLIIVIALTAIFTGWGLYDKWAQKLGAGLAVPITGFANSVVAAVLEHKSEGYVLGSGCNCFKLAGAVLLFGIVSAFVVALIKYLIFLF